MLILLLSASRDERGVLSAERLDMCRSTYRLWEDWNMAVDSCLSDSPSTSFGALAGMGSRALPGDWESPSPGHPVPQSADSPREWHRICG